MPSQAYCQYFIVFQRVQNATGGQMTHFSLPLPSNVLLSGLRLLYIKQLGTISCRFPLYCFLLQKLSKWEMREQPSCLFLGSRRTLIGYKLLEECSSRELQTDRVPLRKCKPPNTMYFSWGLNNSRSEKGQSTLESLYVSILK